MYNQSQYTPFPINLQFDNNEIIILAALQCKKQDGYDQSRKMILKDQHRNLINRKYEQNIYVSVSTAHDTSKASIEILYSYFTE